MPEITYDSLAADLLAIPLHFIGLKRVRMLSAVLDTDWNTRTKSHVGTCTDMDNEFGLQLL